MGKGATRNVASTRPSWQRCLAIVANNVEKHKGVVQAFGTQSSAITCVPHSRGTMDNYLPVVSIEIPREPSGEVSASS